MPLINVVSRRVRTLDDQKASGARNAILALMFFVASVHGQGTTNMGSKPPWADSGSQQQGKFFLSGSPAYRAEVSGRLLQEANRVAGELGLPEKMPITQNDLVKVAIYPPRLAKQMQGFGSIFTSNYVYTVSRSYKFSGLARTHLEQEDKQLKLQQVLPMDQMDTNAAFQLAAHFLNAASINVAALNHDCRVHISTAIPEGQEDEHFVPLYFISWVVRRQERLDDAASVEVFLPDKSLRQLHVNKPEYILRQPLQITNPDFLNLPTNGPARQFAPFHRPPPQ